MSVAVLSCGPKADREILTQVGTINTLLSGVYDGEFTLRELLKRGDLGVGTFNTLNGELFRTHRNIHIRDQLRPIILHRTRRSED